VTGTVAAEQRFFDHDGQRLGLRYHPAGGGGPVVLLLPAMGVPAAYYDPFAARLVGVGLDVLVADLRGTGESTPRPDRTSRYGYADLAGDVTAILATAPELAGRPVLLLGHSLGGHAATVHLALTPHLATPTRPAGEDDAVAAGRPTEAGDAAGAGSAAGGVVGLVLVASGAPYYPLYEGKRRWWVRAGGWVMPGVARVVGYWPGGRFGFGGPQARGVMRDWGRFARGGRLRELGGVDVEAALAAVRLPVLGVSVEDDTLTPAATVDHLCGKFTGAPVSRHHYTAAEAGQPMTHFRWTRAAGPLADRIRTFADEAAGTANG
jgi:predicted alpha/beta hydrolase